MSRIMLDRRRGGIGKRPLRCWLIDDTNTVFQRMVTVGDHDIEPTDDICVVSSPSDMKRREIAKGARRHG